MTVIAGIWSWNADVDVSVSCHAMLQALSIYGNDNRAQWNLSSISLGRCLLRLLPEDNFDRQPLAAREVTAMVADVRLDNREAIAAALHLSSEQIATMADSDMLLAAWFAWGEQCVDHLSGAYAFAIWNEREQHLFLARDHTGERPLFYATSGSCFAFASMPKGLHPLPFAGDEVNEDYLARYLTLADIPIEQTVFRRVTRLPPGSALSVKRDQKRLWRYWNTDRLPDLRLSSPDEYIECFREKFERAVRVRLRTRGGIGAQLSGGLDSGAVAATAAGLLAVDNRILTCFTAVPRAAFNTPASATHFYDEGEPAAEVAALYPNIQHLRVESGTTSFLDILDHNNSLYDHPCFGPSNEVWSNAIYDLARANGISLLLNGNCGNSTFSNEGMHAFSAWLRTGQWATLARIAWQLRKNKRASMRSIARNALSPSLPFWLRKLVDPHLRGFSLDYSVLHPAIVQRLDLHSIAFRDLNETSADGRTMLRNLLRLGDIADTPIAAQGGWQLDYRDPTWDREIIEFCLTVPLEEFLRGGQLRSLARRGMADRLPSSTVQRTKRGRQSADWYLDLQSVRGRMIQEVERLEASKQASRLLDLTRMRLLIERWPTTGYQDLDTKRTHHIALTRGFSVGRFLLQHETR